MLSDCIRPSRRRGFCNRGDRDGSTTNRTHDLLLLLLISIGSTTPSSSVVLSLLVGLTTSTVIAVSSLGSLMPSMCSTSSDVTMSSLHVSATAVMLDMGDEESVGSIAELVLAFTVES